MSARLRHLDVGRGLALLGILNRNSVSFALPAPAYTQFDLAGVRSTVDVVAGTVMGVVADEWPLGLVAMLFGIGIALFVRAPRSAPAPHLRALWRGALLFAIGLAHRNFWEGDILTVYGACMPVLVLATLVPPRWAIGAGVAILAGSVAFGLTIQGQVDAANVYGLPWFLLPPEVPANGAISLGFLLDVDGRALALGLLGVGLATTRFVQGTLDDATYRRIASVGVAVGLTCSIAGAAIQLLAPDASRVAFTSEWVGNAGSAPFAIGVLAACILWCRREASDRRGALRDRIEAVGRTALSTYLLQTAAGITLFRVVLEFGETGRAVLAAFCLVMWSVALVLSPAWLTRFRQGPLEWLWRVATYLRLEPLRRERTVTGSP